MLRIGLTLYLMFVMLAGPALCCCVAERLVADFASPAKQDELPSCACRHQSTGDGQHRSPEQRPDKKDHSDRSSCPCQQHGPRQTPLASLDSGSAKQLQARQAFEGPVELPAILPTTLCVLSHGSRLASKEGEPFPFWTAQDILRALHILRC